MTNLKQILIEFEQVLKAHSATTIQKLRPGLDAKYIQQSLNAHGIDDNNLGILYAWRNGVIGFGNESIEQLELFP